MAKGLPRVSHAHVTLAPLQRTASEKLKLDTMRVSKDKEKDDKSRKAESSRQTVKKLVRCSSSKNTKDYLRTQMR